MWQQQTADPAVYISAEQLKVLRVNTFLDHANEDSDAIKAHGGLA